jgi:hypothetical protein
MESISFNTSEMLRLDDRVSINSISSFNAQEAYENTFEDVLAEEVLKSEEQNNKKIDIELKSLGMPANFELEKQLSENENTDFSKNKNKTAFMTLNFKKAASTYLLNDFDFSD